MRKALLLGATAGMAVLMGAPEPWAQPAGAATEEIIVTARRREEALNRTPVAVTAITPTILSQRNVSSTEDLMKMVPGVVFTGAGSAANTVFTIRGQGKFVIGGVLPSALSYVNEVPLGSWGAVMPTFDMANIQVLKGPQGTLFGRNTTGGAVLLYTKEPTYDFDGYVEGAFGNYDYRTIEGAVNIPIVDGKLAIRVAGELERRDGYTKTIGVGRDADEIHRNAWRVSVLFEPTDFIKNVFVYDSILIDEGARSSIPNGQFTTEPRAARAYVSGGPASFPFFELFNNLGINPGVANCGTSPDCDVDLAIARQLAVGPRVTFSDVDQLQHSHLWGISNTTVIDIGPVTVKNIFGLRTTENYNNNNTGGMGGGGADGTLAALIFNVENWRTDRQITEEIQLSGTLFDDSLDWLVGAFYLDNNMPGPTALAFDAYRDVNVWPTGGSPTVGTYPFPFPLPMGTPLSAVVGPYWPGSAVQNALFGDQSKAIFGNLNYHFGGALEGMRLAGGMRYTSDRQQACSLTVIPWGSPPIDGMDACLASPGASYGRTASNKLTWQGTLDYEVNDDIFVYVTGRKGYRAGGLNTPNFGGTLTPFQTYAPQTITDVELGAKFDWFVNDVRGNMNIALFRGMMNTVQRPLTGIPPGLDGDANPLNDPTNTTLYFNVGKATLQGVEIDGSISPFEDLTLTYAGSFVDGEFDDFPTPAAFGMVAGTDLEFKMTPKWSYSVGGSYRLPLDAELGELFLNANHYWVDDFYEGEATLESYSLTSFSLDWRDVFGKPVSASLFVENAFDNVYSQGVTLSGTAPGYSTSNYGPPRMYGVRLRYEFGLDGFSGL